MFSRILDLVTPAFVWFLLKIGIEIFILTEWPLFSSIWSINGSSSVRLEKFAAALNPYPSEMLGR